MPYAPGSGSSLATSSSWAQSSRARTWLGWRGKSSDLRPQIVQMGIAKDVVFTGYVPDEQLVALVNGAGAFAYPSLYEGFGLPIVEALACGVPVVTSDRGAM